MKWDREEGILSETFFFWDLILLVLCLSLSIPLAGTERVANFSPTTIVSSLCPAFCSPRDIARRRLDPEGQCALLFR